MHKDILQRHRSSSGLSLPNLQYYYWDSNIKFMLYWINPSDNPAWLLLENASCRPTSLPALLYTKIPLSEPVSRHSLNRIVRASFKIWNQFR